MSDQPPPSEGAKSREREQLAESGGEYFEALNVAAVTPHLLARVPQQRDPVMHILAGSNGAGKTTFHQLVLQPQLHLPFINADEIAKQTWGDTYTQHAYDAAQIATQLRAQHIERRESFVCETVFSHESKLDLIEHAHTQNFIVVLHVICVEEAITRLRVQARVQNGGHPVADHKIQERYARMWPIIATAAGRSDIAHIYNNQNIDQPYQLLATLENGTPTTTNHPLPEWLPHPLQQLLP